MSLRPDDRPSRRRDRSASRSEVTRNRSRSALRDSSDDSKVAKKASSQYGYPAAVNMPDMPSFPGDDMLSSTNVFSQPGSYSLEGSRLVKANNGTRVPYPTTSYFPDPSHFDITGASDLEDSLAYGEAHQTPVHEMKRPTGSHERHNSSHVGQYPVSSMPAPSPHAFYASTGSPSQQMQHDHIQVHDFLVRDERQSNVTRSTDIHSRGSTEQRHYRPSTKLAQADAIDHVQFARQRSSSNLTPHMTTNDGRDIHGHVGGHPPASPLLEAYRGTYQSVTPMMAPMVSLSDAEMSDIEPLGDQHIRHTRHAHSGSKSERSSSHKHHKKEKHKDRETSPKPQKLVTLYDSKADAAALCKALSHTHASNIDTTTIAHILPALTHDQMLELRSEYKKLARVNGKGINLSKHLKLKLHGNHGKATYVCALGRWESEGHWANFFYQSHSARRELLIESLMGRSNAEIRAIKDAFRDKRYADDLDKMIARELGADKFRTAVGWALEARRQEETDAVEEGVVGKDVAVLAQSLRGSGSETAMLEIVVRRSDAHLREVLRAFDRQYRVNFAREALTRSGNLVGEVLAHILNGVINRPARDALLLRHAVRDIAKHNHDEEIRYELLISRLVRLHWETGHT